MGKHNRTADQRVADGFIAFEQSVTDHLMQLDRDRFVLEGNMPQVEKQELRGIYEQHERGAEVAIRSRLDLVAKLRKESTRRADGIHAYLAGARKWIDRTKAGGHFHDTLNQWIETGCVEMDAEGALAWRACSEIRNNGRLALVKPIRRKPRVRKMDGFDLAAIKELNRRQKRDGAIRAGQVLALAGLSESTRTRRLNWLCELGYARSPEPRLYEGTGKTVEKAQRFAVRNKPSR